MYPGIRLQISVTFVMFFWCGQEYQTFILYLQFIFWFILCCGFPYLIFLRYLNCMYIFLLELLLHRYSTKCLLFNEEH